MKQEKVGIILVIWAKIIFATLVIFVRFIPAHSLILVYFFQLIGFLCFLIICLKDRVKFRVGRYLGLIILMTIFDLLSITAYFAGIKISDISLVVLIRWLAPVLVALFAFIIGEKIGIKTIFAAIISFIGLFLIFYGNNFSFGSSNFQGIILAIFSAITLAVFWLILKVLLNRLNVETVILYRFLSAVIILTPIIFIQFSNELIAVPPLIPILIAFGFLYGFFATFIDGLAVKRIKVQRYAILGYLEPLTAILLAILLFKESLTLFIIGGGFLILFGSYLAISK